MTTQRYLVRKGADSLGGEFAGGPITTLETDDVAAAQQEAAARGGEVLDTVDRKIWAPRVGWLDDDAGYLESIGL